MKFLKKNQDSFVEKGIDKSVKKHTSRSDLVLRYIRRYPLVGQFFNIIFSHPAGLYPAAGQYCLVNDCYHFIYCSVGRVASGSLRIWFLKTLGYKEPKGGDAFLYSLGSYKACYARNCWREYFKFAFVRHPLSRLVSAYHRIFVMTLRKGYDHQERFFRHAFPVVSEVYRRQNKTPDLDKSITFQEFVEYIASVEDDVLLDEHWRPQSWFVRPSKYDFIGHFESIGDDFRFIREKLNIEESIDYSHESGISQKGSACNTTSNSNLSQKLPSSLLRMGPISDYRSFYTAQLWDMAAKRYRNDILLFTY